MKGIIRSWIIIVMLSISVLGGCGDSIKNPQAYVSFTINDREQVDAVRNLVTKFADEHGYKNHTVGAVPNLKITNQFIDGFHDYNSDNYITSTNFKDVQCIGIAIYSNDGTNAANQIRDALSQYIKQRSQYITSIDSADSCQSKEPRP